jgi:hypothetical protein
MVHKCPQKLDKSLMGQDGRFFGASPVYDQFPHFFPVIMQVDRPVLDASRMDASCPGQGIGVVVRFIRKGPYFEGSFEDSGIEPEDPVIGMEAEFQFPQDQGGVGAAAVRDDMIESIPDFRSLGGKGQGRGKKQTQE